MKNKSVIPEIMILLTAITLICSMFLFVEFASPSYNEPPLDDSFPDYTENVAQSDKIDLNNASAEELTALFGVGEKRAQSIIAYREKFGGFNDAKELMCVPRMPKSVYRKNKDLITAGVYEYEVQPS